MPQIPAPRDSGTTTTTTVPLHWVRYGTAGGAPILVVHGGPGAHHEYLLPQMLALATAGRDLVLYDQRGGGRSRTEDRTPIGWRDHVEDLTRVVAELRLEPLVVVGYSWGALLAMLHAAEAARGAAGPVPRALVLIDPAPVSREYRRQFEEEFARRQAGPEIRALREQLEQGGLRERDADAYRQRAFELSVAGYFADPRAARDLTPFRVTGRVQQSTWDSLGDFDLVADGTLSRITVPSLVIHGRQDPIPLGSSQAAAAAIGAGLEILDGCGHVPYVEQPDALFAAIETFLAAHAND
jgi:proline iminopeptidase